MSGEGTGDTRLAAVVSDVQIPLDNLAYTVEAYLLAHGARLDTDTRFLLAGIRDCADRVAGSVRRLAGENARREIPKKPSGQMGGQGAPQAGTQTVSHARQAAASQYAWPQGQERTKETA